jgi:MFS family permease
MYFAGWTLSSTFVPIIADKKGRRVALLLSLGLLIVTTVLTMTSTSLNFTTIVMFFMGLTGNGLASISYIYVLEGITPNWKSVVGSISCASAYCLPMILSLYF